MSASPQKSSKEDLIKKQGKIEIEHVDRKASPPNLG